MTSVLVRESWVNAIGPLVAVACATVLRASAPTFVSDAATVALVRKAAFPAVFATVLQLTLTTSLDGCLVGAKDFKWIVAVGTCTCLTQLNALKWIAARAADFGPAKGLSLVFATFAARLLTYALLSSSRVALGFGPLGRALATGPRPRRSAVPQA